MKARYESFGGIIALDEEQTLVYVDKDFMRNIKFNHSGLWDEKKDHLSAPTEVHFSITNRCDANCPGCYVDSGKKMGGELGFEELKNAIDKFSEIGVFNLAFGGGEPSLYPRLIELAEYCKKKDIVPNITTNALSMTEEMAKKFKIFNQIHVSLDGLEKYYDDEGSNKTFEKIDAGIRLLRKHNEHVGLNVVVSNRNIEILDEILDYAKSRKLRSLLLLRYKPSGRAKKNYEKYKLTNEENIMFYDILMKMHKEDDLKVYVDCSFIPMLSSHDVPQNVLDFFSVMGCDGGDSLIAVDPTGKMNACSFASDHACNISEFDKEWDDNKHFNKYRDWIKKAKEPCKSCRMLTICKGGCHIIAEHVTGKFDEPDPECPRVVAYSKI